MLAIATGATCWHAGDSSAKTPSAGHRGKPTTTQYLAGNPITHIDPLGLDDANPFGPLIPPDMPSSSDHCDNHPGGQSSGKANPPSPAAGGVSNIVAKGAGIGARAEAATGGVWGGIAGAAEAHEARAGVLTGLYIADGVYSGASLGAILGSISGGVVTLGVAGLVIVANQPPAPISIPGCL